MSDISKSTKLPTSIIPTYNVPFILLFSLFDTLHLGEQELLKASVEMANKERIKIVILMIKESYVNLYPLEYRIELIKNFCKNADIEIIPIRKIELTSALKNIKNSISINYLKYCFYLKSAENERYNRRVVKHVVMSNTCKIIEVGDVYIINTHLLTSSHNVKIFLKTGFVNLMSKILGRDLLYLVNFKDCKEDKELQPESPMNSHQTISFYIFDSSLEKLLDAFLPGSYFVEIKENSPFNTIKGMKEPMYGTLTINKSRDYKNSKKILIFLDVLWTKNNSRRIEIEDNFSIKLLQLINPQRGSILRDRFYAMKNCNYIYSNLIKSV